MADALTVEQVEIWNVQLPAPGTQTYENATIKCTFSCRLGAFVIQGAMLVARSNAGMQVWMPRSRGLGAQVMITDGDVRRTLKNAAKRAYEAMQERTNSD